MDIRNALLGAKEKNGIASLDRSTDGNQCITALRPFVGRMGTLAGGGTYDDFYRMFNGEKCIGAEKYCSWEELISNDWIVIVNLEV